MKERMKDSYRLFLASICFLLMMTIWIYLAFWAILKGMFSIPINYYYIVLGISFAIMGLFLIYIVGIFAIPQIKVHIAYMKEEKIKKEGKNKR